jgi:dienelactone hydrolase
MVKIFRLSLFCLILFAISIVSYADDKTDYRELLSKHYQLQKPDGRGPFPAVILVPGCSGFNAAFAKGHYDEVQNQLLEMGFVTLRVNYLAVRDVPICWLLSPTLFEPESPELYERANTAGSDDATGSIVFTG